MSPDNVYPALPLRDVVVFPHTIAQLIVGRERSVRALERAMTEGKELLLVAQKEAGTDDPKPDDIHRVGTIGTVLQTMKLADGSAKVLVEGSRRVRIVGFADNGAFLEAETCAVDPVAEAAAELDALARMVIPQFEQYAKLNRKILPDVLASIGRIDDLSKLADTVASHLAIEVSEKQELLETVAVGARLERAYRYMESEIGVLRLEKRIRGRVRGQVEKSQRDYFLHEQLRAIQRELDEPEDGQDEAGEIAARIDATRLSKEARDKALQELKKLRSTSPMSPETTVVRNYLDWLLGVPWQKRSRVRRDLAHAQRILDEDHHGLATVKERIVEFLAVQRRVGKIKGPILCLVGPPGVGKTSLGRSIARATGRRFVRMSLGGIRDEADIRGHRRTYIGSMPGRIVQGMKKAGTSNPLFLLDEVDKLGTGWHGDPSAALLEVLDPEQNATFNDHYLEVDYDLSDVLFVTTANTLRMPPPLMDRMEIIRLAGYTEGEKTEIAKRHLIPKQIESHGLRAGEWSISDNALRDLIRYYTREAGVRNLEREIAALARKAVKAVVTTRRGSVRLTCRNLEAWAGARRFRQGEIEEEDLVGVGKTLAWTEVGGELLSVEAVVMPGKGIVSHTGNLGDVMRESVQAARSFVRSRAADLGIAPHLFEKRDIHVHLPDGATPKDGSSAGLAICTSIVSALTATPIRREIAMAGEITLRGRVLAIEGLKEKLLAAARSGITKVVIPKENEPEIPEIPEIVKRALEIVPVSSVTEALAHALREMPQAADRGAPGAEDMHRRSGKGDRSASALSSGLVGAGRFGA